MKWAITLLLHALIVATSRAVGPVAAYGQCGGITWYGNTVCTEGYECISVSEYYSQCKPCSGLCLTAVPSVLPTARPTLPVPSATPTHTPAPTISLTPSTMSPSASPSTKPVVTYLTTEGNQLVDEANKNFRCSGINWFGFEAEDFVVKGLDVRGYRDILDEVIDGKVLGFNCLRLPFSAEMLKTQNVTAGSIDYALNPDLKYLTPLEILDKVRKLEIRFGAIFSWFLSFP